MTVEETSEADREAGVPLDFPGEEPQRARMAGVSERRRVASRRAPFNAALGQRKASRAVAKAALGRGDDVVREQLTTDKAAGAPRVSIFEALVGAADHERVFLKVG